MRSESGLSPYPSEPDVRAKGEFTPPHWLEETKRQFLEALGDLSDLITDVSRRVDEYQAQGLTPDVEQQISLSADYEVDEIITSVIVTGPPAGTATLNLGRRAWAIVMPASGVLVISPIQMSLGRNDIRQLNATAPGAWTLELMGYADVRYRIK